jgi:hypothetical protein
VLGIHPFALLMKLILIKKKKNYKEMIIQNPFQVKW